MPSTLLQYTGKPNLIVFDKAVQPTVRHILKDNTVMPLFKGHREQHDNVWMTQLVHLSFVNQILRKPNEHQQ